MSVESADLGKRLGTFFGSMFGSVGGAVVSFGFLNWIECYVPGTSGPANLYLVGWVAFCMGTEWSALYKDKE